MDELSTMCRQIFPFQRLKVRLSAAYDGLLVGVRELLLYSYLLGMGAASEDDSEMRGEKICLSETICLPA